MTDATLPFYFICLPNGSPLLIKLQLKDRQNVVVLPIFASRQKAGSYRAKLRIRLPQIKSIGSQEALLGVLEQASRDEADCVLWNPNGSSRISMEIYDISSLQHALGAAQV